MTSALTLLAPLLLMLRVGGSALAGRSRRSMLSLREDMAAEAADDIAAAEAEEAAAVVEAGPAAAAALAVAAAAAASLSHAALESTYPVARRHSLAAGGCSRLSLKAKTAARGGKLRCLRIAAGSSVCV